MNPVRFSGIVKFQDTQTAQRVQKRCLERATEAGMKGFIFAADNLVFTDGHALTAAGAHDVLGSNAQFQVIA